MKLHRSLRQIAASLALLAFALTLPTSSDAMQPIALKGDDMATLGEARNIIAAAKSFTVLEGLPHQTWEADKLKQELAKGIANEVHGFPFYTKALVPSEKDAAILRELATAHTSYRPYSGPKRCGGFHPDYALEFANGGQKLHIQLCFGCKEARFHAPGMELTLDLTHDAFGQFEKTLKQYQFQRPTRS
jgi:hypothetical protein